MALESTAISAPTQDSPFAPSHRRGTLLLIGSSSCFAAMSGVIYASSHLSAWHSASARFLIGLVVVLVALLSGKGHIAFRNKPWLLVRGLSGAFAIGLLYHTIPLLGVGKATLINYSYPLFGTLFGVWFLKEHASRARWGALLVAFAGLPLLIIRPGELGALVHLGGSELLGIAGALSAGVVVLSIRMLHRTDNTLSIFAAHCLIGLAIALPGALSTPIALAAADYGYLAAIGFLAATGQLMMTEGFRHLPISQASAFGLLVPLFNVVQGALLFRETFPPLVLGGGALVLFGTLLALRTR